MNRLELIARLALELAGRELPEYSHPKSPKKFTQPQHLVCLVLRAYQKSAYRGTEDQLGCADRLLAALMQKLEVNADAVAMDSTGMEPTTCREHCQMRRGGRRKQYVKLSLMMMILCGCLIPWRVRSFIRLVNHRADGTAAGHWRPQRLRLPKSYGQRWHIKSFMSGLKRLTGSQLNSRILNTLDGEAALRVLADACYR